MKLNNLHPIEHASFSGTFRLTGRVASFDDDGIPYLRLRLSSCANDYIALAVIDSLVIPEKLGHMELVTVKGQQHASMDGDVILLNKMHRPMRREIALLPALQTLPRLACPKPEALDRLVEPFLHLSSLHCKSLSSWYWSGSVALRFFSRHLLVKAITIMKLAACLSTLWRSRRMCSA